MTTVETDLNQALTSSQFTVARALAGAYSHLWAGVPDGTLDLQAIYDWSEEEQSDGLPGGIYAPDVVYDDKIQQPTVVHTTGSGRLSWAVNKVGNVKLELFRPGNICVAQVDLISDFEEYERYKFSNDYILHTNRYDLTHDEHGKDLILDENEDMIRLVYNQTVRSELLFGRHVGALIRPIVALLTLDADRGEMEYDEYREKILQPAIDTAKAWLKPLFDIALPDLVELPTEREVRWGISEMPELPETCATRKNHDHDGSVIEYAVHHRGEEFPVESEKTAIHAVLLLQANPEMSLIDAVKIAIRAIDYRPQEA